ncbi:elongation factor G [Desulfovibrio litoralis]|uniref:Elongation factor G n=1 Tax=Desulfovibrio litoralis DSM 11393 TaxID=1121455 RepID=A0A1M7SWX7_9BACT|nr:elongation factor G [Desulfovibrio litoralis]SHN63025.1 elongation factor G [Desulfovibrio litoralis DSM 11393]
MQDKIKKIRNIGIIAHIDAGKTTTSERILYYTESISRIGEVHEGAATMDFIPEEQEHGITINAAANTCYWCEHQINLIDTPGHVDFTIEVERSLRVLDGVVGVFCAVAGVEPQTETVWRQSEKFNLPKLATINKIDRIGSDFLGVLESMKHKLNINPLPVTVPLGEGEDFETIIDLIKLQVFDYDEDSYGKIVKTRTLTSDEFNRIAFWRERFIEVLSEYDDKILGNYLLGEEIDQSYLLEVIRKLTLEGKIVPVFATSALYNKGIQSLLDAIVLFLPSPKEQIMQAIDENGNAVYLLANKTEYFTALAFKSFRYKKEKLVFLRIYTGVLTNQQICYNANTQQEERINKIYRILADEFEEIEQAFSGDIIAVSGLNNTHTGDSLCLKENIVLLEPILSYQPVLSLAVETENEEDLAKLDEALLQVADEDPTLKLDQESFTHGGQRIISGMGELHLEVVLEKIQREKHIKLRINKPQVIYKETLVKNSESIEKIGCFNHLFDEKRHFATLSLTIKPCQTRVENKINFDKTEFYKINDATLVELNINNRLDDLNNLSVPSLTKATSQTANEQLKLIGIIKEGIITALKCGPLGYPMEGVEIDVNYLIFNEDNISSEAVLMASHLAVRELFSHIKTELIEPIMKLNISVPTSFVGNVVTLLAIHNIKLDVIDDEECNMRKNITAYAFMKDLFGFSTELRSASQGRAGMSMIFDKFGHRI